MLYYLYILLHWHMDFKKIKEKAQFFIQQSWEKINESIDIWIRKIEKSSFVLSDIKELQKVIDETKNTINQYGKVSTKKTIIICAEKWSDFYRHLLSYIFPIVYWKAWTQNMWVKLCNIEKSDLKKYNVWEFPALIVFEDTKVLKVIHWKANIEKVVKNLNMDINELINNL